MAVRLQINLRNDQLVSRDLRHVNARFGHSVLMQPHDEEPSQFL